MSLNEQSENVRRSRSRLEQSRVRLDKLDAEQARAGERGRLAGSPGKTAAQQASRPRSSSPES